VDLIDIPTSPPFTDTHDIVHSTPAFAPTYEQYITDSSSPRQFQWAHQEQLIVITRSLVNAKAESEELKRKCAKLQQTIDRLREGSTSQFGEEREPARNMDRNGQGQSRCMDVGPELYALPPGSHEVGVVFSEKDI
jgi:hypothetical protein